MSNQKEGEEINLEAGYEFPTVYYTLDRSTIDSYLKAVEETSALYNETDLVPPTAVAALAMAALSEGAKFPDGAIHVSQKLNFKNTMHTGDVISCRSRISRSLKRAGMHLITVELLASDDHEHEVLSGEIAFIAPQDN